MRGGLFGLGSFVCDVLVLMSGYIVTLAKVKVSFGLIYLDGASRLLCDMRS